MVLEFVKEKGIEEVVIKNVVIMLLLYADDVVLYANTFADAQNVTIGVKQGCTF